MERTDDLQAAGLRMIQNPELFCFSTDAVLLADYARLRPRERVLDLGAASGILDLLMYAREPSAHFTAVELQPQLHDLLRRNVALNGLESSIAPVLADMNEFKAPGRLFDVCVCNPPYEKLGHGEARIGSTHDIARKEVCITLAEVCECAARLLRWGGRFYLCAPAARLAGALASLKASGLEPKTMRLVHAAPGREARLFLLMAHRGGHEGLKVAPPLFLRDETGTETEEVHQIYHRGEN